MHYFCSIKNFFLLNFCAYLKNNEQNMISDKLYGLAQKNIWAKTFCLTSHHHHYYYFWMPVKLLFSISDYRWWWWSIIYGMSWVLEDENEKGWQDYRKNLASPLYQPPPPPLVLSCNYTPAQCSFVLRVPTFKREMPFGCGFHQSTGSNSSGPCKTRQKEKERMIKTP